MEASTADQVQTCLKIVAKGVAGGVVMVITTSKSQYTVSARKGGLRWSPGEIKQNHVEKRQLDLVSWRFDAIQKPEMIG